MVLRPLLLPPLMAAVVGLVWFVCSHSVDALDPTNVGWVLRGGDAETHMLGWLAFRREPWQFPVGAFSSYLHPVGGTVALTDSMPWLAILFKTVSAWLPTAFQYVGLWLAFCFMLQGRSARSSSARSVATPGARRWAERCSRCHRRCSGGPATRRSARTG
jgi:hypothetical protein